MKEIDTALVGARIRQRREELGLSLTDIAAEVAVAVSTVQRYEKGRIENVKMPVMEAIARVLQVETDWLLGRTDRRRPRPAAGDFPAPAVAQEVVVFPVIGEVAAGYEHLAEEVWSGDTVELPAAFLRGRPKSDYFVLSVHGDSMYPLYLDGDKVLILKADTLEHSGQIGLVLYNGDEATLKRVEYEEGEDWLRLVPVNPEFMPRLIEGAELERCRVLGIPRLLLRELND